MNVNVMINKTAILSTNAPKPASFFSQAVLSTDNKYKLEISGQIGLDPNTMQLVEGGIGRQTEQAFKNVTSILEEIGWSLDNVIKVRVYLTNMSDYQEMNDVYLKQFGDNPPSRVAVAVKELPLGAMVELDCTVEGNIMSIEALEKYNL